MRLPASDSLLASLLFMALFFGTLMLIAYAKSYDGKETDPAICTYLDHINYGCEEGDWK